MQYQLKMKNLINFGYVETKGDHEPLYAISSDLNHNE